MKDVRARISIEGIVQGVGFRPFVYGAASRHGLTGWVLNEGRGVLIEVEGERSSLDSFLSELTTKLPPLAVIENTDITYFSPAGYRTFEIRKSAPSQERSALISPDITTCADCLNEVLNPPDRRYHYPFINCTNCGPRFSIIQDIPYDRDKTTMASFTMCTACSKEYHDPLSRRFHAQPNACPECGPRLSLFDRTGIQLSSPDPLQDTIRLLKKGNIVAIKGLGGFHLCCDATKEDVVARLRGRKYREDKPFALMCRDIDVITKICHLDGAAKALLESKERPIVVLPRRQDASVAPSVAPYQRTLGVMLPYTPLHHLLFTDDLDTLVMTSGNRSDEPIAYKDNDAVAQLAGIADFFLMHDREIYIRCDDSVIKPFRGDTIFMRRARGYVPFPINITKKKARSVLACGAELKNTFCLTKGQYAFVSHHIGDLQNFETMQSFEEGIEHCKRLFQIEPKMIVHDLHPQYLSTRYAISLDADCRGVQHHFAHALSCMAEYGLEGPVLAVVMDGTGYGEDGAVWGGEFLEVMVHSYKRLGHLRYIPLPGGDAAVREPWRMAAAYLDRIYGGIKGLSIPFVQEVDLNNWSFLQRALQTGINTPLCSSIGRLFDAVSALIGLRKTINYEGQAAVELEQVAQEGVMGVYPFAIAHDELLIVDPDPIIVGILDDIQRGELPPIISARFHNTMAHIINQMAQEMKKLTGLSDIVISGGVMQNQLLLGAACDLLNGGDFNVFIHHTVPPNDGGISLGQAFHAMYYNGGK